MAVTWVQREKAAQFAWEDKTMTLNLGDIISFMLNRATLFFRVDEFFVMNGKLLLLGVYYDNVNKVEKQMSRDFLRVLSLTCACDFSVHVPIERVALVSSAVKPAA
jgi:hypothetical protein